MLRQCQTKEGRFVLFVGEKITELGKVCEILLNPFTIDLNDKRCISKLYSLIKERAFDETHYVQTRELMSSIYSYFSGLEEDIDVNLSYSQDADFGQLIKTLGIGIEDETTGAVDRYCRYIEIMSQLVGTKLFVFVNLSNYLLLSEIEALTQQLFYRKINVMLIEKSELQINVPHKSYIIDCDDCAIY